MDEKKVIFVPHCILNQSIRNESGTTKQLLNIFAESEIGIIQLPCPEVEFDGLNREIKAKEFYNSKYRKHCEELSIKILKDVKRYLDSNYKVLGILGIELSPTCGVYRIRTKKKISPGKGILIEEIEKEMRKNNFQVPIISVNLNNIFSSLEKINLLLKNS